MPKHVSVPSVFPTVAHRTPHTGFTPSETSVTNTASELNGTTLPARKADRKRPKQPQSTNT